MQYKESGGDIGPGNKKDVYLVTKDYGLHKDKHFPDLFFGLDEDAGQTFSGGRTGYIITEKGEDRLSILFARLDRIDLPGEELEWAILTLVKEESPTVPIIVKVFKKSAKTEEIKSILGVMLKKKWIVGPKV